MTTADDQAIALALSGRWHDAIVLNNKILEQDRSNTDALNRLAYALAQTGKYKEACEVYHKVLKLDSYNPIATKNLEKFKKFNPGTNKKMDSHHEIGVISPSLFLSDAEKTKTVNLINIASTDILQEIAVGEEVYPIPKRFELHIKNKNNNYIGTLPDDIGHPLLKTINKANHSNCRFFVKDVQTNRVTIFIKY